VAPAASGKSLNGGTSVLSHLSSSSSLPPSAYVAGIVDSPGAASAADRIIPVAMIANLFDFSGEIWISHKLLDFLIFFH
jgi:hypothetical protein